MIKQNTKRVFIETYGCQMNEYDSELVRSILSKQDYSFVSDENAADVIMLNTCAIRENAHQKVYGRVQRIHHERNELNKRNGHKKPVKVGILGCMATNLRTELFEDKGLKIDFIAGPDSYKRLPKLLEECFVEEGNGKKDVYDLTLSEFETYSDVYPKRKKGVNAWIAVMRGCNNFCTFCVVPYTRGRERSRSVANVVEEAKRLADEGFKQITLLGQNVNSYRHENDDFADLMDAVSKVDGIERIRFTSPHPKDFPDKFLDLMADNPKICKQIHLPLQAGSSRVLELMNRTYTKEEFLGLVDTIRAKVPGVALSTDVIVGFCTETDTEFEETLEVMKTVEFDSAFMFKYSERQNTIAQKKYKDDVPEAVKTERIVRLNELQKEISLKKNREHVGSAMTVMLEQARSSKSPDLMVARADNNKIVTLPRTGANIGDIFDVTITDASPHALRGVLA